MTSRLKSILSRIRPVESPIWLVLALMLATALRLTRPGANSLGFDQTFSWLITH